MVERGIQADGEHATAQSAEVTDTQLVEALGIDYKDRIAKALVEDGHFSKEKDVVFLPEGDSRRAHDGSNACYIVHTMVNDGMDELLVGVLGPKEYSSTNSHPFPERYKRIMGPPLEVWTSDDGIVHQVRDVFVVPTGVAHQARGTREGWSVTAILMQGAGEYAENQRHSMRIPFRPPR